MQPTQAQQCDLCSISAVVSSRNSSGLQAIKGREAFPLQLWALKTCQEVSPPPLALPQPPAHLSYNTPVVSLLWFPSCSRGCSPTQCRWDVGSQPLRSRWLGDGSPRPSPMGWGGAWGHQHVLHPLPSPSPKICLQRGCAELFALPLPAAFFSRSPLGCFPAQHKNGD